MEITNFDRVRVGGGFPGSLDIESIGDHESYGVFATAYTCRPDGSNGYAQVRKHNKESLVALFSFLLGDLEIPDEWADSVVLWDSRSSVEEDRLNDLEGLMAESLERDKILEDMENGLAAMLKTGAFLTLRQLRELERGADGRCPICGQQTFVVPHAARCWLAAKINMVKQ